jgi:hypothetical protein
MRRSADTGLCIALWPCPLLAPAQRSPNDDDLSRRHDMAGRNKRTADGTPTTSRRAEATRRKEMEQDQAQHPEHFSRGRDTGRLHPEDREQSESDQDRLLPRENEDRSEG